VKFEVYCDESRPDLLASKRSRYQFMVIGSLWLPAARRTAFKADLHRLRDRYLVGGEFKWNKVTPSRSDFYRELIGWFFDQGDDLRFRCIGVDRSQLDIQHYHDGDQELGFYKFYYQLLHHWILDFNEYRIFVDFKSNRRSDRLKVLRGSLDDANLSSKVVSVQALRSEESVLIQLVDVLTGAAARRFNGPRESGSAKTEVLARVEEALGREIGATDRAEKKFNVFAIDLSGGW
jgi:hypothetical protein